jgi:predicted SprT family Zn-dependent metalloprotease
MKIPKWATNLTAKVLKENNCTDIPTITWRRRNGSSSSGVAYFDKSKGITIRASRNTFRWEHKMVLLHELAHWIRPNEEGHNSKFWKLAFTLYKENKIPMRKALQRETSYRKGAEAGYRTVQGLKPKKRKRKKRINRINYLYLPIVKGVAKELGGKAWAVTRIWDNKGQKRWRGQKITDSLYNRLIEKGYKILA